MPFFPHTIRMKQHTFILAGTALALALAACQQTSETPQQGRNRFGYRGTVESGQDSTLFATPSPTPEAFATPTPAPADPAAGGINAPTPTPAPVTQSREISYGTPVPGKPGFVTSPHAPYAGYVDVRGFPPGTEVKCPYSGKIFLVP